MSAHWRTDDVPQIVAALATRPGHENVRTLVADILRYGFGAEYLSVDHEVRMPEVRGRADLLFGATVFEFKKDLRQEIGDVLSRLPDYLSERERQTRRKYLGIATDGASFIAYELRLGALVEIGRYETASGDGSSLLAWLEPALSDRDDLNPGQLEFRRELGRESLTFGRSREALLALWAELREHPEVAVKRALWDGLLREAYGAPVGDDTLFLQHTYLTIIAKTIAARVLDLDIGDPEAVLSGRALAEAGIVGAVEGDFFDWVLLRPAGVDLVRRVARQVARFRLRDVEADVLKVLYESLIDPEQRHALGEYYTPDWLASKLVREVMTEPLTQRVLDPACGSGTFLFHALRHLIAAANEAGRSEAETLHAASAQVRGIDIHPVAVIIARVTWLLALGETIAAREGDLHVPVYLGDTMQWNLSRIGDSSEVRVPVPGEAPLLIPAAFAEDQSLYEPGLRELSDGLDRMAPVEQVQRAVARIAGIAPADAEKMGETYARLRRLKEDGRNGIWPYVLRNLVRPIWLSRPDQQADLVIGNPPWIAYRHLSAEMQTRLREASQGVNIWVGGVLATQQDMCALFWARCADRYLQRGGTIAFVLPYAVLNRPAFEGVRDGHFAGASVQIIAAWGLERVRPLFPVAAAVLIGRRGAVGVRPTHVQSFAGNLTRRDATEADAERDLTATRVPWPQITTLEGASVYRDRFRNGATVYPRRFFLVEHDAVGRLGRSRTAPRVHGKTGPIDKMPWLTTEAPSGPIEAKFLRPLALGETIAPYRLLEPALAVIPADGHALLDSNSASESGFRHLAVWLADIEAKWALHSAKKSNGALQRTLAQRIDYVHNLSAQLSAVGPKIAYTKAGTQLSATLIMEPTIIIDHMAYWMPGQDLNEGHYLMAIINSAKVVELVQPMQARGQTGPRHFDKLVWELPIPVFDATNGLHRDLAATAVEAALAAASVPLAAGHFTTKRRAIRQALIAVGIAQRIEVLVTRLLQL